MATLRRGAAIGFVRAAALPHDAMRMGVNVSPATVSGAVESGSVVVEGPADGNSHPATHVRPIRRCALEVAIIILSTFAGIATVLGVPVFLVVCAPLLAWLANSWLKIREREVAVEELQLVLALRESQALPPWVDANDPQALLAWVKTDREMTALSKANRLRQ